MRYSSGALEHSSFPDTGCAGLRTAATPCNPVSVIASQRLQPGFLCGTRQHLANDTGIVLRDGLLPLSADQLEVLNAVLVTLHSSLY